MSTRTEGTMRRRAFLGGSLLATTLPALSSGARASQGGPQDGLSAERNLLYPDAPLSLAIAQTDVELAPGLVVRTATYDGRVPGPLLRMREGVPVRVSVTNHTGQDELVHWHGLQIDDRNDGAMEEGSPMIPAGRTGTYRFTPKPAGTRWYHSHAMAGTNLDRAGYSGQFGFLLIEPRDDPARHDREIFLAVHHWDGMPMQMGHPIGDQMVSYGHATFNGRTFAGSEPIRVRQGERVLFRLLNASATQNTAIALPGHRFTVIALDGNPVPHPAPVEVIELGVAERVDAIVEMNNPGVWLLGATDPVERGSGLARAVEYENRTGAPRWVQPAGSDWSYRLFQDRAGVLPPPPDGIIPMVFTRQFVQADGMDVWRINEQSYPKAEPIQVEAGKRYRFRFMNASRDAHPVHFHRHSFELTSFAGVPTRGVVKDTVVLPRYGSVDADWTANNPGASLFHCHQQIHMDAGFMKMINYA
ncbi:MAG: multicopper oxidase family protein [Janthinobacterium lividum]